MTFGGRSLKREELRFRKELRQMTRESQHEYSSLPAEEKAKLLASSPSNVAENKTKRPKGSKSTRQLQRESADGFNSSLDGVPPPSPSIDLEFRSTPDIKTPHTLTEAKGNELLGSVTTGRQTEDVQSVLTGRSTGTASIRAKVDLNVVMQGKGIGNDEYPSKMLSMEEKCNRERTQSKPRSARGRRQSPRWSPKLDELERKPAIIGTHTTTVPIQLTSRPALKTLADKEPCRATSQSSTKSRKSQQGSLKETGVDPCLTPTEAVDGICDMSVSEDHEWMSVKEDTLGQDDELPSTVVEPGMEKETETAVTLHVEESNHDSIHSQIQALTHQLSMPQVNILTLMEAVQGEEESKEDVQALLVSQRESILMKILAERGSMDFSVLGAMKNVSPRDTHTPRTPMRMPEKRANQSQGDDGTEGKDHRASTFRSSVSRSPHKELTESPQKDGFVRTPLALRSKDKQVSPVRTDTTLIGSMQTGVSRRDVYSQETVLVSTEKAKEDLQLPAQVTAEDVINIKGQQAQLLSKDAVASINSAENLAQDLKDNRAKQQSQSKELAFLGTWQATEAQKDLKHGKMVNIHHFCTLPTGVEIPPHLSKLTRDAHTRDRFPRAREEMPMTPDTKEGTREDYAEEENRYDQETENELVKMKNLKNAEEKRLALVAQRIIDEAIVVGDSEETLQKLKGAADCLFASGEEEPLDITGGRIELKHNSSRLYWTPAPPKMSLAPETIKSKLFPEYHGSSMLQESLLTEHRTLTVLDSDDEGTAADGVDFEDNEMKIRYPFVPYPTPCVKEPPPSPACQIATKKAARNKRSLPSPPVISTPDTGRNGFKSTQETQETTTNRILSRTHGSMSDIHKLQREVRTRPRTELQRREQDEIEVTWEQDIEDSSWEEADTPTKFMSVLDKRRQESKARGPSDEHVGEGKEAAVEPTEDKRPIRRAFSQPQLTVDNDILQVSADYDISMEELNYQLNQLAAIKTELQEAEERQQQDQLNVDKSLSTHESLLSQSTVDIQGRHQELDPEEGRTDTDSASAVTGTSRATALTRTSRLKPPRRTKKKSKKDEEREKQVKEFLEQPARPLSRSTSFHHLEDLKENEPREDQQDAGGQLLNRQSSVSDLLDFDKFTKENSVGPVIDMFDWVREQFWYNWFDEVYPPSPPPPEIRLDLPSLMGSPRPISASKSSTVVVNNAILDDVQVIEPEISEKNQEMYTALEEEVTRLAPLIDTTTDKKETLSFYLCRRGAVYRKLGRLKLAWDDLNRSIELEPNLLDAYWHRHLLHLLREDRKAALEDLTFIIKNNSKQARAFRSRAELYRIEGDPTMAIVSYSQAIKLNPNDAETYYQRASMFRKRGDMILAIEDYKMAAKLQPSKTEAMHELGLYHFEHGKWNASLADYSEVLQQDPHDSVAYTYRARSHAKMRNFDAALRDLSAAVHYGPNNAVAFYHRGCLLRKLHPRRALQDFSVSLLLDTSEDNVNTFLHRGILYTDMKRWDDAIPDFEAALHLDPNLASAHVNIGLIYITRNSNYYNAIRRFTAAIHVDPTYIRAYICRAEAHHKVHMLRDAVLDYTRVIHLRPDVSDYHMARGRLLLEQNKLDLASFHVRQAAELNQGLGASATQQAVVQSFLRNFDQAIEVLERATRVKPVASLFVLLGKTNMKAKIFPDAITSFNTAIEIMTPWDPKKEMPQAAALVYFLIGMCHSELDKPGSALDAFNNAIKVNPEYAEAFYQRGLTKMKLVHSKGIHDFNRALAINPNLFQAFLSRAAYYGMKGRFSKGIMSCNEAIKLQPHSVRAYLYRGALKYHIKAYGLAVKDLTEAVAIDCKCALAYFNRAVCYHEMRFFQKALMDYGTVMLLEDKPNLKVLQNRALLYLEIDDVENALQDFLSAAEVSMFDPKIRHTIGLCYHKLNRLLKAVAAYNDALQIDPFFVEAYNGRGNALMDFGHETGNVLGRRDYLKALHMDPTCLSARVNLAYNLQVEGRFQAAWNQFSAAISMDQVCPAALEGRAVVNLQMQNTFGAFIDMNEALKISKTAELLTNRGVVHQFMGDYVNAVRDYQAALRTEPSFALAYYNVANVYFRQRQFQQAVTYYDKALSWDADDESAVLNRAIAKVMLKDAKGALFDFNKAVELNPYAAHVYFNRGNLYASTRKYKDAEEDYTRALSLRPGDALVYKKRADVLGKQGNRTAAIENYKKAIIIQTRRGESRAT